MGCMQVARDVLEDPSLSRLAARLTKIIHQFLKLGMPGSWFHCLITASKDQTCRRDLRFIFPLVSQLLDMAISPIWINSDPFYGLR